MQEGKLWLLFFLACLALVWTAGFLVYGDRPDKSAAFLTLIEAGEAQDISRYYGRLVPVGERLALVYNSPAGEKQWCIENSGSVKIAANSACGIKKLRIDQHAASSIVMASYHLKGVVMSEYLTGHIKLEGFSLEEIIRWAF